MIRNIALIFFLLILSACSKQSGEEEQQKETINKRFGPSPKNNYTAKNVCHRKIDSIPSKQIAITYLGIKS